MKGCTYVNPDILAKEKFGDWNSADSVKNAADYARNIRESCLAQRGDLAFETVFSAEDKLDFVKRAKDIGYFIRLFFISTQDPTINASRVAQRMLSGGHEVPLNKIISRYFKAIALAARAKHVVDRLYLYDNSADGLDARLLARLRNSEISKQYVDELPEWAVAVLRT
jgi:predicted ABC-type ATPase